MVRWSGWYLGLAAAVVALAGLGVTHAQPGALGDNNQWVTLFPALRTAPAPAWLRPGMRFTYYSAFARVAADRTRYQYDETCNPNSAAYKGPDPDNCFQDENGRWVRRHTGGIPGRITGEDVSGHGFTEVNVAALDGRVAVLDTRSLNLSDANGPLLNLGNWGSVELPGAGGDWWLNPQVVRGAAGLSAGALRVMPIPYAIRGKRYNALWFTLNSAGRQVYVYDMDTGALLHTNTESKAAPGASPGATLLSQNTLSGTRTLAIPWAPYPAPDWVRQVSLLRYEGGTTSAAWGSGSIPVSVIYQRQAVGMNWVLYLQTTHAPDATGAPAPPAQVHRAYGSAQFFGLWVPPQGLAQLRQGQVLDNDPVTRMRTYVGFAGRTSQGANVVTIAEDGTGQLTEFAYDRASGALVYFSYTNKVLQTKTQLQLRQRQ